MIILRFNLIELNKIWAENNYYFCDNRAGQLESKISE